MMFFTEEGKKLTADPFEINVDHLYFSLIVLVHELCGEKSSQSRLSHLSMSHVLCNVAQGSYRVSQADRCRVKQVYLKINFQSDVSVPQCQVEIIKGSIVTLLVLEKGFMAFNTGRLL